MAENEHVTGHSGAKARKWWAFLCSTAGGRELRLEARPPARLICWRTSFLIGKVGHCAWFGGAMAAVVQETCGCEGDYEQ